MSKILIAPLAFVAGLAFGPAAIAQDHPPMPDPQIQTLIEHRLGEKQIRGISVAVANGVVTLTGTVRSLWEKNEATDQARKADDVRSVVSNLTIARGENDTSIAEEVARNVRRYVFFTIFDDVAIAVDRGVVTLTGRVTMPYKAGELEALASRVPGVQDVRNELAPLPVSISDDQLRAAISSGIYRDPVFWNYAIQARPPIHIIVENGRVTLTGVVLNELERRKAEIIARGVFGVFSVDNQLRTERR